MVDHADGADVVFADVKGGPVDAVFVYRPRTIAEMLEEDALVGVRDMLRAIGETPDREGLKDTPMRVLKAMREMTSGHQVDIADLLKTGFDSAGYDEVVCVANIEFSSMCEHHLLPFVGVAHVAYLPEEPKPDRPARVVGLSKLPRLVDAFAKRLQLQEQMTTQIAGALNTHLQPRGTMVVVEASHSCCGCRGVRKPGVKMVTSYTSGVFRQDAAARAEVFEMIRRAT